MSESFSSSTASPEQPRIIIPDSYGRPRTTEQNDRFQLEKEYTSWRVQYLKDAVTHLPEKIKEAEQTRDEKLVLQLEQQLKLAEQGRIEATEIPEKYHSLAREINIEAEISQSKTEFNSTRPETDEEQAENAAERPVDAEVLAKKEELVARFVTIEPAARVALDTRPEDFSPALETVLSRHTFPRETETFIRNFKLQLERYETLSPEEQTEVEEAVEGLEKDIDNFTYDPVHAPLNPDDGIEEFLGQLTGDERTSEFDDNAQEEEASFESFEDSAEHNDQEEGAAPDATNSDPTTGSDMDTKNFLDSDQEGMEVPTFLKRTVEEDSESGSQQIRMLRMSREDFENKLDDGQKPSVESQPGLASEPVLELARSQRADETSRQDAGYPLPPIPELPDPEPSVSAAVEPSAKPLQKPGLFGRMYASLVSRRQATAETQIARITNNTNFQAPDGADEYFGLGDLSSDISDQKFAPKTDLTPIEKETEFSFPESFGAFVEQIGVDSDSLLQDRALATIVHASKLENKGINVRDILKIIPQAEGASYNTQDIQAAIGDLRRLGKINEKRGLLGRVYTAELPPEWQAAIHPDEAAK